VNATQLQFDEDSHTYTVNGVRWPSVTQILEPLQLLEGIPQHILDAAAQFGSHVHQACHLFDIGRLDEQDLDEPLRPYLEAWKKFLCDTGFIVLASEQRVWHPALQIAGTYDKLGQFPGKDPRHVLDVKTGADVPWTVGPQTAAYREMLSLQEYALEPEWPLSKVRFCCHLKPDATYRLVTLKDYALDWNDFVSAANFNRMRMTRVRRTR
jgi:hypothetical protein